MKKQAQTWRKNKKKRNTKVDMKNENKNVSEWIQDCHTGRAGILQNVTMAMAKYGRFILSSSKLKNTNKSTSIFI